MYDGNSTSSPVLATLCGRRIPRTIHSTGRDLFFRFSLTASSSWYRGSYDITYTSSMVHGTGIYIYFLNQNLQLIVLKLELQNVKILVTKYHKIYYKGCGGTIYNVRGVVTSPMYPTAYTENSDCRWNLRVPDGHLIAISFRGKQYTC